MAAAVTMQLLLLVVVMLLSSNLVESEPITSPPPSQLPNFQQPAEKFDLQTIQECTSSFLDVKECLIELFNFFHGGARGGLPGGGPPDDGGGGGPPDDGYGEGGGGVLGGMGGGGVLGGMGGGGLPGGIGGGGNIISPVCCEVITGIKKNCWPMMFPNPIVAPMVDSICGPVPPS